jgi:hypothetical protein
MEMSNQQDCTRFVSEFAIELAIINHRRPAIVMEVNFLSLNIYQHTYKVFFNTSLLHLPPPSSLTTGLPHIIDTLV